MNLQIQLSSCIRFDFQFQLEDVTKQKNKNNPETPKNDQRHNEKMNTSQIHYMLNLTDSCICCLDWIFEFWREYLFDHGLEWNHPSLLQLKDPRDLNKLAADASPATSPHVAGQVALICQFPSVVSHVDHCLIIDYFCSLKQNPITFI